MKNIIKLSECFIGSGEVAGMKFTKIASHNGSYCYQISSDNIRHHFEVIKPNITPLCVDFTKRIYSETEFKESYPKAREFGVRGWSFYTKESAIKKLMLL